MGARQRVVMCGLLLATAVTPALAQRATLEPSKLSVFLPAGWQVTRDRAAGDFLHWETADEGGRSFDISFERIATKCKVWKAAAGTTKESATYWPKAARTPLFVVRADGKITQTGCLADTTGGALVVRLVILVEDSSYKPSKDDATVLTDALAAVLEASEDLPPLVTPTTQTTTTTTTTTSTTGSTSGPPGNTRPPNLGGSNPLTDPSAVKGGTVVALPHVPISIKLPKTAAWMVGTRGESVIERADGARPTLTAKLFPLAYRTCNEWRVDMSTNAMVTYEAKPKFLPAAVKVGAFSWMSTGVQVATCVPTKVGTVGISIDYGDALAGDEITVVRQLVEAIAVGAAKHAERLVVAPTLVDGGNVADASVATIQLPKGATWRVDNGTIERFDKGKYFSLWSMSRPECAAAPAAKEQPYLPAGIKGTVDKRAWGATVVTVCIQGKRNYELTLAYDGAIAPADHALIKALVTAFVPRPAP